MRLTWQFTTWTGYLGSIIADDVISEGRYVTNQISYTYTADSFSAFIGAEQGSNGYQIDDYLPHILGGAKFKQAWGSVAGVAGYDSVSEEWAGKVRLDVSFTDTVSAWVMGGYKSDGDVINGNYFGAWNGDYAVWGGIAAKVSDKATVNAQVGYEEEGTVAAALNVAYTLVPGFVITPEVNYTKFDDARQARTSGAKDDAFQGIIRFQRNF